MFGLQGFCHFLPYSHCFHPWRPAGQVGWSGRGMGKSCLDYISETVQYRKFILGGNIGCGVDLAEVAPTCNFSLYLDTW